MPQTLLDGPQIAARQTSADSDEDAGRRSRRGSPPFRVAVAVPVVYSSTAPSEEKQMGFYHRGHYG